jgi:hypothetical protein
MRARRVEAMVLQFGGVWGVGCRPEVDHGSNVEGPAAGTQEIYGEPAVAEDRTDVTRRVRFQAGDAEVAWLHPGQVVYVYLQDPYR